MFNNVFNRPSTRVSGVHTHTHSQTRSKPVHADPWTNKAEAWWIGGPVLTSLTSHLFEPQQFRGLHLRWHDAPNPAENPMVGVCYTRGLIFRAVVHPHHHVPERISWTRKHIQAENMETWNHTQHIIWTMHGEFFKWQFTNILFNSASTELCALWQTETLDLAEEEGICTLMGQYSIQLH